MTSSSLGYLLCEGGQNIKANRQMSVASIGVLVACMLLIGASMLFSMNVNAIMGYVESINEMVVFIKDDISQEAVDTMNTTLKADENVASCIFISKSDALKRQMELMSDAAELLQGLDGAENPLPASFRIKLRDLSLLGDTVTQIGAMEGVDYVSAPTDIASTLVDIKHGVTMAGLAMVAILGVVAITIISNTIKVTIFSRRKEINIMKYVGATDAFIRIPFLVEGVIIGLASALIAYGVLWVGYDYIMDWMSKTSSSWLQTAYVNLIPFADVSLMVLAGFTVAGTAFGILGSLFFVSKYLKV